MSDEVWKQIPGFAPRMVSNLGRVLGSRGKILALTVNQDGYLAVSLYGNDKKRQTFTVHKLVAHTFLGKPESGYEVAHNNGIKTDNRLENLRYATHRENITDMEKHGTIPRGTRHPSAKLTEELVRSLRMEHLNGGRSIAEMARQLRVDPSTVFGAVSGKRWKHVN